MAYFLLYALYVRKNTADPLRQLTIVLIEWKSSEIAKMRQNQAKMAKNTCLFQFCTFGCKIWKIYAIWKWSTRECGYFLNFRIFIPPLDKKVHIRTWPLNFLSFWACQNLHSLNWYFSSMFHLVSSLLRPWPVTHVDLVHVRVLVLTHSIWASS